MARIEDLSPKTRARLAALLGEMLEEKPAPAPAPYVEPEPQEVSEEAFKSADRVIKALQEAGKGDYTSQREAISILFDHTLWNGNWEAVLDDTDALPGLLFIQEDEYDQSMTASEKPKMKKLLAFVEGHYIFPL